MKITDLSLYPKPNSCFLVKTINLYHGNPCMAETVLLAIEATVLYCPSKISSLIGFVCIDETNLFKVKKVISMEF